MCLSHQSHYKDHPGVFFSSLEPRLPPGCDRQLYCFFRGGRGLPAGRKWSSGHSALLVLLSFYVQASRSCDRGTGYQSPPAQRRAGRGLRSKKGALRCRKPNVDSSRSSPLAPSWLRQNHSALSIWICLPQSRLELLQCVGQTYVFFEDSCLFFASITFSEGSRRSACPAEL